MGSDARAARPWLGASRFALGLGVRAGLIGLVVFGLIEALAWRRLYATALVLAVVALIIGFDLLRSVLTADRELGRFVEDLAADSQDRPGRPGQQFPSLAAAITAASGKLQAERLGRQQQLDYLQTLADSVTAALLVIRGGGEVVLANRAAQRLAGGAVSHLRDIALIGEDAAQTLLGLAPGARTLIQLKDGRAVLAQVSLFSTPRGERQKLISLQDVARELGAIELKAWQDLVRILAHEMMNSLTPIVSLAASVQALQRDGGGSPSETAQEVAAAVEVIARRSQGLMNFVDGYRKVAELPRPALQTLDLTTCVASIDRLMSATFAAKGVAYHSRIEPSPLMAVVDPDLLEQAIINLLKNALDAVDGVAQPRISLSAALGDEEITITVADNGPGLAPEARDRLFVPFFTTKPGGSGIGLSIARQIALAHHGQLEVADDGLPGARFVIRLPQLAVIS